MYRLTRLRRNNPKSNASVNDSMDYVLRIIEGLDEDAQTGVIDNFTKKVMRGNVDKVYQWVIDMDNDFDHLCDFELL
jgi:hypothetical protein